VDLGPTLNTKEREVPVPKKRKFKKQLNQIRVFPNQAKGKVMNGRPINNAEEG